MSKTLDIAEASGGVEGGPEEERLEAAYWRFDARHKGYWKWKEAPMSERDAFKAEMRNAMAAEKMRAQARLIANGWRKSTPDNSQNLLEALKVACDHIDMSRLEISHCNDAAL